MLIKVRQFLTKEEYQENPVPFRTMQLVEKLQETAKAVRVKLQGKPVPQNECVHCGRTIKHPQSLFFGIGSTCIKHFPQLLESVNYEEIETSYANLIESMSSIVWEGWLPKSSIEFISEGVTNDIIFIHNNTSYHVQTKCQEKLEQIMANADKIVKMEVIEL